MQYRREVDGLRAVAVVPVILWHAGFQWISGGFVGVDIFFVISGFLITSILIDDLAAGRFSIWRFYERRARRILPALFLVMGVSIPFAWAWLQPELLVDFSKSMAAATFFVSNIYFWLTSFYFNPSTELMAFIHTWSLSVEEQFYLAYPPILFVLWKIAPRHIAPILTLVAVASLGLSEWGWRNVHEANFFLAPTRAWELLAGAVAAIHAGKRRPLTGPWAEGLGALGLAMTVAAVFLYDRFTPMPSVYGLLPVGGTVLVLLFARSGTLAARLLSLGPVVGIGAISYSAYLWHQTVFALARARLPVPPSTAQMVFLILLSLGLAALSWRFVERPFRQRGPGAPISVPRLVTMLTATAAVLTAASAVAVATGGAHFRFSPAVNALSDQFRQEFAGRADAVREGYCEFNSKRIDESMTAFLKNWPCRPAGAGGTVVTDIAIYGDSHASDVAAAVRLNGHDVAQLTVAGCPLAPAVMVGKCRQAADYLKAQVVAAGIRDLWLINRFDPPELTPGALRDMVDYWKIDGVRITLFSPMPEFPDMEDRVIKAAWLGETIPFEMDQSAAQAFLSPENRAIFAAAQVRVIDAMALFCAGRPVCAPVDGKALLMVDGNHLSVEGARRYGAALWPLALGN